MSKESSPPAQPTFTNYGNVGTQGNNYGVAIGQSIDSAAAQPQTAAQLAASLRDLRVAINASIDDGKIDSATYKRAQRLLSQAEEHVDEDNDTVDHKAFATAMDKLKRCFAGALDVAAKVSAIISAATVM